MGARVSRPQERPFLGSACSNSTVSGKPWRGTPSAQICWPSARPCKTEVFVSHFREIAGQAAVHHGSMCLVCNDGSTQLVSFITANAFQVPCALDIGDRLAGLPAKCHFSAGTVFFEAHLQGDSNAPQLRTEAWQ